MNNNVLKKGIAKLAEFDIQNHARLLRWTTSIIWACSLMAEVGTFYFNKKLPDKEKGYIIRQELTAGGISLVLAFFASERLQYLGERMVRDGKLIPKELPEALKNKEALTKILAKDEVFIANVLKGDKTWVTKLAGFKNGVGLIAGLLGTILGDNIFTPIVSNKIASYYQNKALKEKGTAAIGHVNKPLAQTQPTFGARPQHAKMQTPAFSAYNSAYRPFAI